METKRCPFCDQTVPVSRGDDRIRFNGCSCAPESGYSLDTVCYESCLAVTHQVKRERFPLISAYIRELTESGEAVTLKADDLETIPHSPRIPVSTEEKEGRFLSYLRKRTNGPGEPVTIRDLSSNFNLTYSANLQELIYIIENLRDKGWIERTGTVFKLTEPGWKEAEAGTWGKRAKLCVVAVPPDDEARMLWLKNVFPRLESNGYAPRFAAYPREEKPYESVAQVIADSALLIVDLTGEDREVIFAAGYAQGAQVPVIGAVKRSEAGDNDRPLPLQASQLVVWDNVEELANRLEQAASSRTIH